MSAADRGEWAVRASDFARNTHNKIRNIVERLRVEPNPDKQLIALSIGDPTTFGNLNPPNQVLAAVREAIECSSSRGYSASVGDYDARRAVAEYSAHQGKVTAEDVYLTSGCSHALELAITCLANPGQSLLVPRPGFGIYKTLAKGLGIRIKYYNLLPKEQWQVDIEDLEARIDGDTVALVVINPSNPCGSVYTEAHLREILEVASRNRVPIIADEIYEHLVFTGNSYRAISSLSTDVPVLMCGGIGKRFVVPGWRLGWAILHDRNNVLGPEFRYAMTNLCGRILGPNAIMQRALPAILSNTPQSFFDSVVAYVEENARIAYESLRRVPGLRPVMPQGAMYMMIGLQLDLFPQFRDELHFVEALVSEQSVFPLPGQCFSYPNFVRIVLTVPHDIMREACGRIELFCLNHAKTTAVDSVDILTYSTITIVDKV